MAAFEQAASFGVGFIESDLHVSSDGVLHCFHDPFLDRTTNDAGPIHGRSAADLAILDAGYRHRIGSAFPFRGRGIGIPTFASVVAAFPDFGFVIDLKSDGVVEPLARMIQEMGLASRLVAGSFSTERVERLREMCSSEIATSTGPAETIRAIVSGHLRAGFDPFGSSTVALQVPISWYGVPVVTEHLVAVAHRFGRLLHVWTINEAEEIRRLLDLGVDGIITDRPDLAVTVI